MELVCPGPEFAQDKLKFSRMKHNPQGPEFAQVQPQVGQSHASMVACLHCPLFFTLKGQLGRTSLKLLATLHRPITPKSSITPKSLS
jgi:hypothetical protein